MMFAAFGVWFGGWADNLVQRVTEANMILPVVAIAVLFYAFYGASLWTVLTIIVVLNAFGSPTKTFRAAFIQVKQAGYIEAAQAYGAPNARIIFRYMIPRILPVLIPQLVTLIPGFIFLEATLGMFNVKSILPTWGKVIYEALSHGAAWGSRFWVLEPITLLLLTGFAFSMMGFALDRVLNPRLQNLD
jgi:peptide/nickel transport system permease protein